MFVLLSIIHVAIKPKYISSKRKFSCVYLEKKMDL